MNATSWNVIFANVSSTERTSVSGMAGKEMAMGKGAWGDGKRGGEWGDRRW